jgi:hypothetical protein
MPVQILEEEELFLAGFVYPLVFLEVEGDELHILHQMKKHRYVVLVVEAVGGHNSQQNVENPHAPVYDPNQLLGLFYGPQILGQQFV